MNGPSFEINLKGFFGVVENVNDPDEAGRVQVRVDGLHSQNEQELPTDSLPWFSCSTSNTSGSGGFGTSATGYATGSLVFGVFFDTDYQGGLILGAISGIPGTVSDVSVLARSGNNLLGESRNSVLLTEVQGPLETEEEAEARKKREEQTGKHEKTGWSEPPYHSTATYPNNDVYHGKSGITQEFDNTPNNVRINLVHPSGSYNEIRNDGTRVDKIVGDGYEITVKDKRVFIGGACDVTIVGDCRMLIEGNVVEQVNGNKTEVIQGNYTQVVKGERTTSVKGNAREEYKADVINTIKGNYTGIVNGNYTVHYKGKAVEVVDGACVLSHKSDFKHKVTGNYSISVSEAYRSSSKSRSDHASDWVLDADGTLTLQGTVVESRGMFNMNI